MKKIVTFLVQCSLLLASPAFSQDNFWNSPQAYLGQKPPGNIPEKFAASIINDSPYFSMDRSAFSLDGKEFYYVRNNTWFSTKDETIQEYKFDGNKWAGPTVVTPLYYAPAFSSDGNTLYFEGGGKGRVLQSHRTANGWGPVDTFIRRDYGLYDFMPVKSGNAYAASNINGPVSNYNCYDICIIPRGDTMIHTLGKPINTPGFDGDFYIAPDESYMVLSAKEQPDFECQLYISYHKKDGSWTNPKSLGEQVNNDMAHRWGEYVTPDNKYLFYSYGHSPKDCAIYWVRFDNLLETLKHTNFEPYVKDSIPAQTFFANKHFSITVARNTFYDDDGVNTLTYSATLADGSLLPSWLTFDARKKVFSGAGTKPSVNSIQVTATDTAGATASSIFSLTVK